MVLLFFGHELPSILFKALLIENLVFLHLSEELAETSANDVVNFQKDQKTCEILDKFKSRFALIEVSWEDIEEQNWHGGVGNKQSDTVDGVIQGSILAKQTGSDECLVWVEGGLFPVADEQDDESHKEPHDEFKWTVFANFPVSNYVCEDESKGKDLNRENDIAKIVDRC